MNRFWIVEICVFPTIIYEILGVTMEIINAGGYGIAQISCYSRFLGAYVLKSGWGRLLKVQRAGILSFSIKISGFSCFWVQNNIGVWKFVNFHIWK